MISEPGVGARTRARSLRLPPVARSVRTARHFARDLLVEAGHEEWTHEVELALSEIVTNAVLHAHTEVVVRIRVRETEVAVEVEDKNPALPAQRRAHEAEVTTGRGLELVSAITRECGVRPQRDGKVVWFTVGGQQPAEDTAEDVLGRWGDPEWDVEPAEGSERRDVREVVLLGLPPTLWTAAREHHQAILRELVLYLAEHHDALPSPPDLVLADEARTLVWTALTAALDEVEPTRDAGPARLPAGHPVGLPDVPATVDLRLQVPPRLGSAFGAMQDALDVAEQLAVADLLLVRPGLPEIIAVRDWLCEQVVAQLAGVPPTPWAGAHQPRFTNLVHDRANPAEPEWDPSVVTASDRGVVAADDANRIIAISAPLAEALGWAPAEIVGRRVVALVPPALREAHVAGFSRHLSTGQTHVLGVDLELPVLHRDGSELPCRFLIERADVGSGRPVYLAWITPIGA